MTAAANQKSAAYLILAVLMLLTGLSVAQAQEKKKKFTKKDVPAAVVASFEKTYPKAKINAVSKEEEKGTTYYEIESVDGKTKRDLLYTADGKVYEIEESLDAAALPAEIKNTLTKEYPKAKIVKAEKVTHESTVGYELHLKVGKETKEIVFDSSGNIVKGDKNGKEKEEDEEDDDD